MAPVATKIGGVGGKTPMASMELLKATQPWKKRPASVTFSNDPAGLGT